jgi:hypothetical protein
MHEKCCHFLNLLQYFLMDWAINSNNASSQHLLKLIRNLLNENSFFSKNCDFDLYFFKLLHKKKEKLTLN